MIKKCLPKVGIKFLKISHVTMLFPISLLFVAMINPYSVFKFLIFNYHTVKNFGRKKVCKKVAAKDWQKILANVDLHHQSPIIE